MDGAKVGKVTSIGVSSAAGEGGGWSAVFHVEYGGSDGIGEYTEAELLRRTATVTASATATATATTAAADDDSGCRLLCPPAAVPLCHTASRHARGRVPRSLMCLALLLPQLQVFLAAPQPSLGRCLADDARKPEVGLRGGPVSCHVRAVAGIASCLLVALEQAGVPRART